MPPKRQYTKRVGYGLKKKYGKSATVSASKLQSVVRRQLVAYTKKNLETKQAVSTATDGTEIAHNNFVTLDSSLLETVNGTQDANTGQPGQRIGDQITLKGVSLKMMIELNERYSDVTYRLMVIKKAKGDSLSKTTLFNGLSGNKMLDTINTERFTVLAQKYFKITAPNLGANSGIFTGTTSGAFTADNNLALSRATKIIKLWIPYKKFSKNGVIQYENIGQQTKFFDYHVILFAYSNYSTSDALNYNVGRVNDYIKQVYFTDA